jgi:Skp family chaperone for outer membrane proteins
MKGENIWRWALVGSLTLIGGGLLAHTTASATANTAIMQPASQPVAVVNLELLIDMLDERAAREQELQEFGNRLERGVNDIRARLRERASELDTASDSRARELYEEILRLRVNLEAEQQFATQVAGDRLTRLKRDLYRKVLREVAEYAASAGYALVISDDSSAGLPDDGGLQALELTMMNRKVLYSRDTVDITNAVANRMNTNYKNATSGRGR